METISRQEAKRCGLIWYFTGKPCTHGHIERRFVSCGTCHACHVVTGRQSLAKEGQKRRYSANETLAKATRARAKAWQAANPEQYRENQRRWRETNQAKIKTYSAEWAKNNPERTAELNRAKDVRRKARKRDAPGDLATDDLAALIKRSKGKCAGCGKRRKLEVDHIVSLKRGGTNEARNLQMLCRSCNARKSHKDPLSWAAENGRLV